MKKLLTIVINDAQNDFRPAEPVFLSRLPLSGTRNGMIVNARAEAPMEESEPVEEEPYIQRVGDRVRLEGEMVEYKSVVGEPAMYFFPDGGTIGCSWRLENETVKTLTLLSRKSPRKITRAEIEKLVGEAFEIVDSEE